MEHQDISQYIAHLSYAGIFLWFLVIEQLVPVPEEVSIMSLGYIAAHTALNPFICWAAALSGLLVTDSILYYLSVRGSRISKKLLNRINRKIMNRIQKNLKVNTAKTLLFLSFIPKLRFFSPIAAGVTGISWKYFFLINSIATILYLTVYMLTGIFFHNQLEAILHRLELLKHSIFILVMIFITVIVFIKARKIIFNTAQKDNPS